ncbi:MAG: ABC transporter permease [Eubacterium sp.]
MIRKFPSIIKNKGPAVIAILVIIGLWELICVTGWVPRYMLPTPGDVLMSLISDWSLLWENAEVTLQEAIYGLLIGIGIGFVFAVLMDMFDTLYRALYPVMVLSQTIPTVAIAPLLVLWFGYEMKPKIILVVIASFFPIAVGLLDGFKSADPDSVNLLRSMGAGRLKIFRYLKAPSALPSFFSGLRIATAYSVVTAVISEWLGGFSGLGVYMTRVKKAYAFDKMFAVIIIISVVSLLLMAVVSILERVCLPYRHLDDAEKQS